MFILVASVIEEEKNLGKFDDVIKGTRIALTRMGRARLPEVQTFFPGAMLCYSSLCIMK